MKQKLKILNCYQTNCINYRFLEIKACKKRLYTIQKRRLFVAERVTNLRDMNIDGCICFPLGQSSRKSRTMKSWFWKLSWLIPSWPWSTGVKHLLPQLPVVRKYLRNHGPTWLYKYSINISIVLDKTYHNVWVLHLSLKCDQSFLNNIIFL